MFDVGFSELLMVGLVALLALGPEKLPKAAREAGFWLGRLRHISATVKAELQHELHAEEMRQIMRRELAETELRQILDETEQDIAKTLVDVKSDAQPKSGESNEPSA
jgi:sec-independent protein translocase protein TatB